MNRSKGRVFTVSSALYAGACGPTIVVPQDGTGSTGTAGGDRPQATVGASDGTTTLAVPPSNDEGPVSGDESLDSDGPGQTFLIVDDMPSSFECSIWDDDCPDGDKCTFAISDGGGGSFDSTRCVPIVDNPHAAEQACKITGEPGAGFDTCEQGSICWGATAEDRSRTCVAFCVGSAEVPTCASECAICSINSGPLALCFLECDAVYQDCPEGQGCYPLPSSAFACLTDTSGGMGQAGQPCEFINGCTPGAVCLPASNYPTAACQGASGCCTPTCIVGDPNGCVNVPEGVQCVPWYLDGEAPKNECGTGPEFGICVV